MCACVRTFVTSWEVLRAASDQTAAVALHLFTLFVNLLSESLRSNLKDLHVIDWFLSGGLPGQARLARTS